jgi:signal transduction histidine kinase
MSQKLTDRFLGQSQVRLWLSVFWLAFTFSLTVWWWIFGFRQLHRLQSLIPIEQFERSHRMLLWEGAILIGTVFVGGVSLVILANRDRIRHEQMKLFFGNFAHDLKTSMSRLRLQTEMDEKEPPNRQAMSKLRDNINRLDLQLENSLWVARGESQELLPQNLKISNVLSVLRAEWPELEISLEKEAVVFADEQALRSVLRNLVQNASLHGGATRVQVMVAGAKESLRLSIVDNGKGYDGDWSKLGRVFLSPKAQHGNGLGLYLTRFLVEKMNGHIGFLPGEKGGFISSLELPAGGQE